MRITRRKRGAAGPVCDEGVYLVTAAFPVRLPLNETIQVWPAGHADCPVPRPGPLAGATILARHEMWLCGHSFLTLDYYIARADLFQKV